MTVDENRIKSERRSAKKNFEERSSEILEKIRGAQDQITPGAGTIPVWAVYAETPDQKFSWVIPSKEKPSHESLEEFFSSELAVCEKLVPAVSKIVVGLFLNGYIADVVVFEK